MRLCSGSLPGRGLTYSERSDLPFDGAWAVHTKAPCFHPGRRLPFTFPWLTAPPRPCVGEQQAWGGWAPRAPLSHLTMCLARVPRTAPPQGPGAGLSAVVGALASLAAPGEGRGGAGGLGLGSWPFTPPHGSASDFLLVSLWEAHFLVVQVDWAPCRPQGRAAAGGGRGFAGGSGVSRSPA